MSVGLNFLKGRQESLSDQTQNGSLYFCTDTGNIFLDTNNETEDDVSRLQLNANRAYFVKSKKETLYIDENFISMKSENEVRDNPGQYSVAIGPNALAPRPYSHSTGNNTQALGEASHAEGAFSTALGNYSHAEGYKTFAHGNYSHAEGCNEDPIITIYVTGDRNAKIYTVTAANDDILTNIKPGKLLKFEDGDIDVYATIQTWDNTTKTITTSKTLCSNSIVEAPIVLYPSHAGVYAHTEGYNTTAAVSSSHAEGADTVALGNGAHAEGWDTLSSGNYSHAEGIHSKASGIGSHAEGDSTEASEKGAHAEGNATIAKGLYSHAEGQQGFAYGAQSHVEGGGGVITVNISGVAGAKTYTVVSGTDTLIKPGQIIQYKDKTEIIKSYDSVTKELTVKNKTLSRVPLVEASVYIYQLSASGASSHAEGSATIASGSASHAEGGYGTTASGTYSHAEGYSTTAFGSSSHAEGYSTIASGNYSHVEGRAGFAYGQQSHVEGLGTVITVNISGEANAQTYTVVSGTTTYIKQGQIIQYKDTTGIIKSYDSTTKELAIDNQTLSDIELVNTPVRIYRLSASGQSSHAEGRYTTALGLSAHAEGLNTSAIGENSHAEGTKTYAIGANSHAEGSETQALNNYSHAEGSGTKASANAAHAEGVNTIASGSFSHAEGRNSISFGRYSHAEGNYTTANSQSQHVQGEYNILDTANQESRGTYAHIVGNGTAENKRSNAHTLDWDGNAWFAGQLLSSGLETKNHILLTNDSGQPGQPGLKWKTINAGKTPYIGYCTGSTDSTFMIGSLAGTSYTTGLAIGGTSGNLLWKANKVVTVTTENGKDKLTISGAISQNGKLLDETYAPISHAIDAETYGLGSTEVFGHVKLSDSINSSSQASAGVAATPYAVKRAYDLAASKYSKITGSPGDFVVIAADGQSLSTRKILSAEEGIF